MTQPTTPAQRAAAAAALRANAPRFPLRTLQAVPNPTAPSPFDGVWCHSTSVENAIRTSGWCPALTVNTIYGAAVYLSRSPWDSNHPNVIVCRLDLQANEVLASFASGSSTGTSQDHVIWHLKEQGLTVGRNASPGTSTQNQAILSHFITAGVRAICFSEHGREVVAVYDPNCIIVV